MPVRLRLLLTICIAIALTGCPSTKESTKSEEPPPSPPLPLVKKPAVPEIFVRVAAIDLSNVPRKIDTKDVAEIAELVRKKNIDILSIEGMSRYPGLKNRIDVFDEIGTATDMRKVFGENITVSGRQMGNAVYSTYPIRSHLTTPFEEISSANFESALQAVIDCGVREIVVVSSRLPQQAPRGDIEKCLSTIRRMNHEYVGYPIILAGNLPSDTTGGSPSPFSVVHITRSGESERFWYSNDGSLKFVSAEAESTGVGPMTISEFGIFRKPHP